MKGSMNFNSAQPNTGSIQNSSEEYIEEEVDEDIEEDMETIETDPDENVHHPLLDDEPMQQDIESNESN